MYIYIYIRVWKYFMYRSDNVIVISRNTTKINYLNTFGKMYIQKFSGPLEKHNKDRFYESSCQIIHSLNFTKTQKKNLHSNKSMIFNHYFKCILRGKLRNKASTI